MAIEQDLNKISQLHKESQKLLDEEFKERKLKEKEILIKKVR